MAYVGPWGVFYHIPKCGGWSVRLWLDMQYNQHGSEWHGRHDPPPPEAVCLDKDRAFTVVRHPAYWLRSYYSYMNLHNWSWPECPDKIMQLFLPYKDLEWADFVDAVTSEQPGSVGYAFSLYTLPGVEVHRLRSAHWTLGLNVMSHTTPDKPPLLTAQRTRIERAEIDMLLKYQYV